MVKKVAAKIYIWLVLFIMYAPILLLVVYSFQNTQYINLNHFSRLSGSLYGQLFANDEIWFCYKNTVYQIDHGLPNIITMYITKYKNKQKISERSENFSTVAELLNKFTIDGKTIKEIWDDVTF